MSSPTIQFGRTATLLLTNETQALDLSAFRFRFSTSANDTETPNTAEIRIYNLAQKTTSKAIKEYSGVVLSAGYPGTEAVIFKGTIITFRSGKESNIDSYLDIKAADGDVYSFATSNFSIQNATAAQEFQQLVSDLKKANPSLQVDPNATGFMSAFGGILPRGKVAFGATRDFLRDLANTTLSRWSIQNGVITVIPLTSYLPGEAVQLNSLTGLIGVPEATDNGISVRCLINPKIKIGHLLQINNQDIAQTTIVDNFFPNLTVTSMAGVSPDPNPQNDGFYRPVVIEHTGDTRGQDWYTDLVCLTVDPTVPALGSVLPYGGASAK